LQLAINRKQKTMASLGGRGGGGLNWSNLAPAGRARPG
jgi:hypothetical protein